MQSYTERPELWQKLENSLPVRDSKTNGLYAVAIQGLGGAGKSQLALKYAESKRDQYNPIFWIDAVDKESARSSFRKCAVELQLPIDQDEKPQALADDMALQMVHRWLRDRKEADDQWLIIVDNADDFTWGIKEAIPREGRGSILITSQDNQSHMLVPGCERIAVGTMSAREGTTLLLRRLGLEKNAATETIQMLCARVADELLATRYRSCGCLYRQ